MEPFYTLLICLPTALALIACGCGVAVLWSPTAQPTGHPTVGRRCGGRARRSKSTFEIPIHLVCAIVLVAVATTCEHAFAFSRDNHEKLTEAAFRTLADPGTVAELRNASLIGDSRDYEPLAPGIPWNQSAAHYDNCAWYEGRTWVKDHRHAAVTAALVYDASPTADNRRAVIDNLGFVLHATEDFYAHSNWVETHEWGQLANLEGEVPAGWISGTYPDDTPKDCPVSTPSHGELNKDDASRPHFAEAYADAILAVQAQLAVFASELCTANPGRADAILTRLGLRAQPACNSQVRYTAVWRPSTEGEIQVYGWTYEEFRNEYDQLWPQGWRLKLLQPYVVNGQVRYTAVWRPSTEGEIQVYGWSYADYRAKYDQLWPQGWRLQILQAY
jgi:hypothetical protein